MDTSKSGMTGNNAKVVLHINGVNTPFVSTNEPSGNFNNFNTNGDEHSIGNGNGNTQGNIYLAEFIFLDGQYEDYTSFGSFKNGVWIPKDIKVEFAPSGNNNSFVTDAECGCDFTICPCELLSQLNWIAHSKIISSCHSLCCYTYSIINSFKWFCKCN